MADIADIETLSLSEAIGGEVSFTQWLSQHIDRLGDKLGLELEAQGTEAAVGTYRADIVAKADTGEMVVIEAQYGRTDHNHLGQILTYAGGVEASVVIWVAEEIREEHRAGLDWLNNHSELRFFGIEAKAIRIENSRPAISFDVVSSPNDWSRDARIVVDKESLTETEALRLEYWTALNQLIDNEGVRLTRYRPARNSWNGGSVGRSDVWLNYANNQRDNWVQVEIYLGGERAKEQFDWLYERREDIERELGELEWARLDHRKASRIRCRLNADITNRGDWNRQHQWIIERRLAFDRVFRPIITQDAFPT
ncbi:MAG: DUF4268 domain-containing protein [Candidatus Kerfeldbacteria bacterium]|nr:DUF4268 domain-containing protein [Candidatus Kerfeldbacteria bacterium]